MDKFEEIFDVSIAHGKHAQKLSEQNGVTIVDTAKIHAQLAISSALLAVAEAIKGSKSK